MLKARANINKEVLKWAREQAGYSEEEAARKLQVTPERYLAWENPQADLKPTFKQLRKISKVFKRPVSVFYLPKPPEGFQVIRDFRRLPGDGIQFYSPSLLYEMELAQQRRELALDLYKEFDIEVPEFTLKTQLSWYHPDNVRRLAVNDHYKAKTKDHRLYGSALGLGVDEVRRKVRLFNGKIQLGATDDCGFSPFSIDVKPKHGSPDVARDIAFKKIANRVKGVAMASKQLGV